MPPLLDEAPNVGNVGYSSDLDITDTVLPPDVEDLPLTTQVEGLESREVCDGNGSYFGSLRRGELVRPAYGTGVASLKVRGAYAATHCEACA